MTNIALEVDHVFKKFKRGELYDSLRDLVPALAGRFLKGQPKQTLQEREFWALHDVCLQVERGEAFGILGSNGAGKSTILKLLTGIMKPTKGTVKVNGRLSALIEVSAGFHPDLTGRENIFLKGAILGMSRKEIQQRFDEIVAFSGLAEFIDTPVKRYSSGMFARLGFSVAAHVDPDILIVDEVLSVGDFAFQKKCVERMTQVIHSGATVIFVSHNLRAVAELCPRSLLLDHGRVLMIGPTDKVIRKYLVGAQEWRTRDLGRDLCISNIQARGVGAPRNHFQAGDRVYVDVEVTSRGNYERLAVVITITNPELVEVFNTSTERLGASSFSLHKDEKLTCTFALDLHLVPGTYYVSGWIHRYDIQKEYDHWESAETFFVSAEHDVKGVANLYPIVSIGEVKECEPLAVQASPKDRVATNSVCSLGEGVGVN
jgi:ABC-type polysaccharide/polyol phosphate transport system ATPase subunit